MYSLAKRKRHANVRVKKQTALYCVARSCAGLIKLDVTPGGGGRAGRFNSLLDTAFIFSKMNQAAIEGTVIERQKLEDVGYREILSTFLRRRH